ncbi:MAG TPA: hypothetical protein VG125_21645 [Pirellulales bacterium]|nr:hypothetical protein [Pirellulales bacterium]
MFAPVALLALLVGADPYASPVGRAWPPAGVAAPLPGPNGAPGVAPPVAGPAWAGTAVPQSGGPEYGLNNWQWRDGSLEPGQPTGQPQPQPIPPFTLPVPPAVLLDDTAPYYDPFTRQFAFGNAGFQPYHLGWYFYDEVPYMPTSPVRGVPGSFQDIEYNTWVRYARLVGDRYLFSWTGTWNSSWWTGPSGVNLPPGAEQLVSDFQISSLYAGPWNWQVGVAPQIDADFRRTLDHNAYMVDGRFVLFYQATPELRLAAGIEYWNRVHGILIPYGGFIWAPNNRWEFRIFFPQTRISRYFGNVAGKDIWTYGSLGWNAQAWQVTIQDQTPVKTRMQMSYAELLIGVSAAAGKWTAFAEGGLIFDRRVIFRSYAPPFTINDTLMVRLGLLW